MIHSCTEKNMKRSALFGDSRDNDPRPKPDNPRNEGSPEFLTMAAAWISRGRQPGPRLRSRIRRDAIKLGAGGNIIIAKRAQEERRRMTKSRSQTPGGLRQRNATLWQLYIEAASRRPLPTPSPDALSRRRRPPYMVLEAPMTRLHRPSL
jgi:hypothetical protein